MIKTAFAAIALLIGNSTFALAAGGGAAAAAGGHSSGAAQSGSSFGKPAVGNNPFPGVTARPGCVGGFAGVGATGAPSPMAPPGLINPSPTNGSAVKGLLQSNPDVPRLTQQDQRLIGELKRANDKLGEVGNTTKSRPASQQPGQPGSVAGSNAAPPPLPAQPQTGSSALALKESTDRGSLQGKPDVLRMSEQDQRLFREIIRDTQSLAKIGNPGASAGSLPPQAGSPAALGGDIHRDPTSPHRPTNTMGAAAGGAC